MIIGFKFRHKLAISDGTMPMWVIAYKNPAFIKAIFSVPGIDWNLKYKNKETGNEFMIFELSDQYNVRDIVDEADQKGKAAEKAEKI
jgi:hypothetical protein